MSTTYQPQHRYPVVPSLPDHRDYVYAAPAPMALPPSGDLGDALMPPVFDRGRQGSCTSNSMCSGAEYLENKRDGAANTVLSRAFLYLRERQAEHDTGDSGAQIRTGLDVLLHKGVCLDATMPYHDTVLPKSAPRKATSEATKHKISWYGQLPSLEAIKGALNDAQPVICGFTAFQGLERLPASNILPMPAPNEQPLGGHAVLVRGWDDARQLFRIRNSWGTGYGLAGDFFMPYQFAANPQYCFEFWTFI